MVIRRRARELAREREDKSCSFISSVNESYVPVKSTNLPSTLSKLDSSQEICLFDNSFCFRSWWIGILRTIVVRPVLAERVEVTAESMPPETPMTRVDMPLLSA